MADLKPTEPMTPRDYIANCISNALSRSHYTRMDEVAGRIASIVETASGIGGIRIAWEEAQSLSEEAGRGAFKERKS